jgi:excinuclease ABC subunit A
LPHSHTGQFLAPLLGTKPAAPSRRSKPAATKTAGKAAAKTSAKTTAKPNNSKKKSAA